VVSFELNEAVPYSPTLLYDMIDLNIKDISNIYSDIVTAQATPNI